jgi:ribose 5-phosphate isomerase A
MAVSGYSLHMSATENDSRKLLEQKARQAAGEAAAALVQPGMVVGLGTGDTAAHAIRAIAARYQSGGASAARARPDALWDLRCVATSRRSAALASELGLPLVELDQLAGPEAYGGRPPIDVTIDGADEIDPQLQLIKGAGGALLFEKLVAQSSQRLVVVADAQKQVGYIGEKRLLPVEVVTVGHRHTRGRILGVAGVRAATLRQSGETPYRTDGGNLIYDLQLESGPGAPPARALHADLKALCGVIETGLFCCEAERAIIGNPDGSVTVIGPFPKY